MLVLAKPTARGKVTTMKPLEVAGIVELAAQLWSNVKDTQPTRDAWFLALSRTNYYDALDALGSLAGEKRTIHVSDVVKRAARIRSEIVRSLPPLPDPPRELADNPQAFIQWSKTYRERQLHQARLERHLIPA